MATLSSAGDMLPSDIVTKRIVVMERTEMPSLNPTPGTYVGDLELQLVCEGMSLWTFNSYAV
jgi:hypothetical protein